MSPQSTRLLDVCVVHLAGSPAPPELQSAFDEVTVEDDLYLPDIITIRLTDPDLKWADSMQLAIGTEVEVRLGDQRSQTTVGIGEIVALELDWEAGQPRTVVQAYDRAHRLHRGTRVRTFQQMSDGDVVQRIASEAGLSAQVESGGNPHEYLIQDNVTDYEFLADRALRNGFELVVDNRTLHFRRPNGTHGQPVTLKWGENLRTFRARLAAAEQLGTVEVRGWDPGTKQAITAQVTTSTAAPRIGASPDDARQRAFGSASALVDDRPIASSAEAQALAQAALDQATGSFVRADGTITGDPALRAGGTVEITGVGQRLSGSYYVTSTVHSFGGQRGYETAFSVRGPFTGTIGALAATPRHTGAGGRGAPVIGIVTNVRDPNKSGRVKVKFPWLSDSEESTWARLVTPMAGPNRGLQLIPEVNDEVLVVFEHGDINRPLVLGGLWNGSDAPPLGDAVGGDGNIQKRGIVTRAGHQIVLDDSSGGGGVTIKDSGGNEVSLAAGGGTINLKSAGDLTVEATGTLTLKGASVKVSGTGQVAVSGSQVSLNS
jgi:phage protein D